ncbi:hypothetical protein RF11_11421 [Thelohanellus kitauei]|uniref:Uncharacterized protein n=1 Tax=Thelohanellus kitauei TaxID=669202 RepID=A0A0C2J4B2_THEKT|nr:hypothetical protein RF11_11421 [Thelohanellus kitauei]
MRLVGDLEDPDSYFIERQLIHLVAWECNISTTLKSEIYMDRTTFKTSKFYSDMTNFDAIMEKISHCVWTQQTGELRVVFPIFLNPGCPFYYLNKKENTEFSLKMLLSYYTCRAHQFILPDVVQLRDEFERMNDFIFSETFLDFIMECFVKWYKNPDLWKLDSPDLFLFILLCLLFILMASVDRTLSKSSLDRMYDFFGPQPKLGNRSLFEIIDNEHPNCQNPLVTFMMEIFIQFSHMGERN